MAQYSFDVETAEETKEFDAVDLGLDSSEVVSIVITPAAGAVLVKVKADAERLAMMLKCTVVFSMGGRLHVIGCGEMGEEGGMPTNHVKTLGK